MVRHLSFVYKPHLLGDLSLHCGLLGSPALNTLARVGPGFVGSNPRSNNDCSVKTIESVLINDGWNPIGLVFRHVQSPGSVH